MANIQDLAELSANLQDWPKFKHLSSRDALLDRVCQILNESKRVGKLTSKVDLAVLLRHILTTQELSSGKISRFQAPKPENIEGWPTMPEWRDYGFIVPGSDS